MNKYELLWFAKNHIRLGLVCEQYIITDNLFWGFSSERSHLIEGVNYFQPRHVKKIILNVERLPYRCRSLLSLFVKGSLTWKEWLIWALSKNGMRIKRSYFLLAYIIRYITFFDISRRITMENPHFILYRFCSLNIKTVAKTITMLLRWLKLLVRVKSSTFWLHCIKNPDFQKNRLD